MSDNTFSQELDRSLEFFENPSSYRPFDLTPDLQRILGCIDPRDQEGANLRVVVQTSGGAVGEAVDAAIALTVTGEETATIEQGMTQDHSVRHTTKLCAHHNCKFIHGINTVLGEMSAPSDFTMETYHRWVGYYRFGDRLTSRTLTQVTDASKRMNERNHDEQELVSHVSRLYPDQNNVGTMIGENNARIYVVNHHPLAGLDRNAKHRGDDPLKIQGYHDSLGATIMDQQMTHTRPDFLIPRLSAHILRAAAVRTVIGGQHEDTIYLEAQMTTHGLQVAEVI